MTETNVTKVSEHSVEIEAKHMFPYRDSATITTQEAKELRDKLTEVLE